MIRAKPEITDDPWVYPAVDLDRLDWPVMQPVIEIVAETFKAHGYEAVISCGCEVFKTNLSGQIRRFIHSLRSLHYRGRALDFSCNGIPMFDRIVLQHEIQEKLDKIDHWYEVILHGHFHIEFDEK